MEQKHWWRIVEKRQETAEAVTLELEPEDGATVAYLPGQYLPVIRAFGEKDLRRAYSFSTCPGVDARPAITVKRIPNGAMSTWLVQRTKPGDRLLAAAPAGQFFLPKNKPRRLIYVAAGSGITPVMSHLKKLLDAGAWPDVPVALIYANRDSAGTIFKQEIDRRIARFPKRFSCTYVFSRETNVPHARHGHLNNGAFEKYLLDLYGGKITARDRAGTHVFLCAPTALMRMARMTLRVLDFADENIHQETFVPDTRRQSRTVDRNRSHRIAVTEQSRSRLEFSVFSGETILDGALRQGIELPYTCKSGVCLSCLARCVSGEVDVAFVEQTRREGPGALVNTCIGYAVTEAVELAF